MAKIKTLHPKQLVVKTIVEKVKIYGELRHLHTTSTFRHSPVYRSVNLREEAETMLRDIENSLYVALDKAHDEGHDEGWNREME